MNRRLLLKLGLLVLAGYDRILTIGRVAGQPASP
jgi:hypothetical protein